MITFFFTNFKFFKTVFHLLQWTFLFTDKFLQIVKRDFFLHHLLYDFFLYLVILGRFRDLSLGNIRYKFGLQFSLTFLFSRRNHCGLDWLIVVLEHFIDDFLPWHFVQSLNNFIVRHFVERTISAFLLGIAAWTRDQHYLHLISSCCEL